MLSAVRELDAELVLEENHVAFTILVLHLLLETSAESVQGVVPGGGLLVRENTDPSQTSPDGLPLLGVLERGLSIDGTCQGLIV